MAFYFDDMLTASDAEQALRYKFSHVDIRPGSARSFYTTSSSSKNSTTPLRSASTRNKLVKHSAKYTTPIVCASWPCRTPQIYEPPYHSQYQYYCNRQGSSYLDL